MIPDQKIGQLLLREGVITESQLQEALEAQGQSMNKSLGEVMLNLKIIEEADFLRVLAKQFYTQFVTTKKLSELKIPEAVLKMIPKNTAEKHRLFPVQYKRSDKLLTVVMANPGDVGAVDEVKFVSGIGNVKTLVGMDDAIKAAIDRWYENNHSAFDDLLSGETGGGGYELGGSSPPSNMIESEDDLDLSKLVSSSDVVSPAKDDDDDEKLVIQSEDDGVFLGGMSEMPGDNNNTRDQIIIEDLGGDAESMEEEEVVVSPAAVPEKPSRKPDAKRYRLRMLVVESHDSIRRFIAKLFSHEGFKVKGVGSREEAVKELEKGEYDSLVIKERDLGDGDELIGLMAEKFPGVELCSIKDYGSAVIGETRAQKRLMTSFLETLDILMGLLEMEGAGMQGHSHNVGKYARLMANKLDLAQRELDTIALAGYVHDLGKKNMTHWTVFKINSGMDADELMEQAEIPLKLLSSAKYQLDISPILRHQYERWDGQGLPGGLQGEDIPVGSRILALVEAFEDLTSRYASERPMEHTAALEFIKEHAGSMFDPSLVNLFLGVVRDDIYLQQMSGSQEKVLIADTEGDQLTLLELRLVNMGYAVASARTGREALEKAKSEKPSLILTESEFPDFSGFELIEKIKADPATRDIPFLFISRRDDSNSVTKGFRLGAEDYMIKPVRVEILAAKINNLITKLRSEKKTAAPAAAGVSGSLSEMSLPDIIQILGAGRKTGRITLEDNGRSCYIDMEDGQVVNAMIEDLKGEDAFYKILYWNKGSFSIDPTAELGERLINMSNDGLMLEGFRRMDEHGQGGGGDDIALDGSDFF